MHQHTNLIRTLLLAFVIALALVNTACETYVGVGVGYGYPGSYYGGPWSGGYVGRPYY